MPQLRLVSSHRRGASVKHFLAVAACFGWPLLYLLLPPLLLLLPPRLLLPPFLLLLLAARFAPAPAAMNALQKEYFSLRVFAEEEAPPPSPQPPPPPPPQTMLFSMEPHDLFPLGMLAASDLPGGGDVRCCVSDACFALPGLRSVIARGGAVDARRETMDRLLAQGTSLVLCPGGVHEVCHNFHRTADGIALQMHNRLGMVRLAQRHGAHIVPCFAFGQGAAFSDIRSPLAALLGAPFAEAISRRIGFAPLLFRGAGGVPFAPPAPTPIDVVVGAPIPCPATADPHTILRRVVADTERIFQEHKARFGMQHVSLCVL